MLCNLCPRCCNTDRDTEAGLKRSLCHSPHVLKAALVSLHAWEEPCISGRNGAGTIFFSHCNLKCVFCQNHTISAGGAGQSLSPQRLTEIIFEQAERGASVIELVTPTHYTDLIVPALQEAKAQGLTLPVVWNSNGYERTQTLQTLSGLVDVFIPDLKYMDAALGRRYSGAPDYPRVAQSAIKTMFDLAGPAQFDSNGIMTHGVIVRHLVLPGLWKDSCACVQWLYQTFGDAIYISLMNQYTPMHRADQFAEINRPLLTLEYQKVVRFARSLGVKNAFIQVGKTASSSYIPVFDGSGVNSGSPIQ